MIVGNKHNKFGETIKRAWYQEFTCVSYTHTQKCIIGMHSNLHKIQVVSMLHYNIIIIV